MLLDETIKVAFSAIRANKMRSMLTMLGIVIGIAAVITMVALGEGAQRSVSERLQQLGTNILSVNPGQQMFGGVDRGAGAPLLVQDAEALSSRALELAKKRQTAEAEKLWKQALTIQPNLFSAAFNLGLLYFNQEKFAEAEPLLSRAARAQPC